jgi:hypothetical protein
MEIAMIAIDRFFLLVRDLRRSERGMALPTAMFAMIACFGLASVAVLSSVDAQRGTHRDSGSKSAIAAADAGASVALMRLNRYSKKLSAATPCIGPAGEVQTPTGGWCPSTAAETVGGASFAYRVSAFQSSGEVSVVSVGAAGGVSRRVNVKLASTQGKNVFLNEQLIGETKMTFEGGPTIKTNVGSNGNVEQSTNGKNSIILCGDIRHGIGKTSPTPQGPPTCPKQGTVSEGNKTLPPVVPPTNIATENSNCRLVPNCSVEPTKEVDPYVGKARTATKPWDAAHRFITVENGASLTMGGKDYFVCGLFLNGELFMQSTSRVRIFFDKPENCPGLDSKRTQIEITATATVKSTAFGTSAGTFDVPGFYVMGSPTLSTTVKISGSAGSQNELMLYAPYSNLVIGGNATWIGMFAGKSVEINGNPTLKSDSRIPLPDLSEPGLLQRTRYVECTGVTATPPDASC